MEERSAITQALTRQLTQDNHTLDSLLKALLTLKATYGGEIQVAIFDVEDEQYYPLRHIEVRQQSPGDDPRLGATFITLDS